MREIGLILLLIALALGGCAVTVTVLQPTLDSAAHAWVQAETATDPIDDLVRFRQAERDGRVANILLPVFIALSAVLLLLTVATPLPRILKELRLLQRVRHKSRRAAAPPPWLEQSAPHPPADSYPAAALPPGASAPGTFPPLLPPPQASPWLEDE